MGDRNGAPSGTVTFALTDVEGSTKLARALGDEYAVLIGRHHELLRSVWREHGGFEIATEGDAFIVAFDDADAAVLAAVDAQRQISAEPWPGGHEVRIRIGLHAGYARPVDGDYRALSLNQASRIVGCAHGGQTFATDEVVALLTERTAGIRVTPLGMYRVRDFDAPVRLHFVTAPDLPVVDAAPRVRPATGHNMVAPTTAIVGREHDVASIGNELHPRAVVTIAGPGGVGKTRLAVEVGMSAAPRWPDGVWFVDLAAIISAGDVPVAVATAVGASVRSDSDVWADVLAHLEHRDALVVLDNCEHVAAGVAVLVRELLARCGGVAVLATSRVPLGLVEEHVRRLPALAVGRHDDPGVQLFLQRAAGDAARFRRDDVVALCRELDGLPLAIELAAARTSAITPGEILARLRDTPGVLRSRDPGRPERQRSLGRSLDWSYWLLDAPARTVYRRLSVFASGFDLDAAARVCAGDDVAADDVAELVWTLVDASLLQSDDSAGATRYRMLTVVRAHARSVADDEEIDASIERLARLELDRVGPGHPLDHEWRNAMSLEIDNVRHVVGALGATADVARVALAQTLAWSIGRFHDTSNTVRAGIDETARWAAVLRAPTPERAALLTLLAELHLRLAETAPAQVLLDEAVALAADVERPDWDDAALDRVLGELEMRRGAFGRAMDIARDGLERARTPRGRARLLNLLALGLSEIGDNVTAAEVIREEIAASELAGMEAFLVTSYGNLAEVLQRVGDAAGAAASQLVCLELSRSGGGAVPQAFSMIVAAHLAAAEHEWARAVILQSAADVALDHAEAMLYGADTERRRQVLDDARRELGEDGFQAAVATGRSLGIDAAADIAAAELRRVAARREERV